MVSPVPCVLVLIALCGIGVNVVVPKLAQQTMDDAVITIHNSTIFLTTLEATTAELWNDMTITSTSLFGAKLHKFNTSMMYEGVKFASFDFPDEPLQHGDNNYKFQASLSIQDVNQMTAFALGVMTGKTVELRLVGKADITAFGIPAHPNQDKTLFCKLIKFEMPGTLTMSMECTKNKPTTTTTTTSIPSIEGSIGITAVV